MRHAKNSFKIGRTGSHRRAMISNMLKSLIEHGRIETTLTKAKELRRHADRLITLAKKNTLASKRGVISKLKLRYNKLTSKETRKVKTGKTIFYNSDRLVVDKLFGELRIRFEARNGGYTRIIKKEHRVGDNAPQCFIEYLV